MQQSCIHIEITSGFALVQSGEDQEVLIAPQETTTARLPRVKLGKGHHDSSSFLLPPPTTCVRRRAFFRRWRGSVPVQGPCGRGASDEQPALLYRCPARVLDRLGLRAGEPQR